MKKIIPNAITSANLFCGCLAVTQIAEGNLAMASLFVILGAFFDFFDGMAARLLKVTSPVGAELDSLADMITFGLAPSYLVFVWLNNIEISILNYGAFLLAVFSAIRLAKFNVDDRQTTSFIGLPTPANALFWISLPMLEIQVENGFGLFDLHVLGDLFQNLLALFPLIGLFSYLLIAELPLLSLKFKTFVWEGNEYRFILLIFSGVLIGLFYFAAIPFIITLYLILSIIQNNLKPQ